MPENPTPTFSVIIPTHNREDLLRLTLDSVLAQSSNDFEVIVVDDGSTDGTPDMLRSYGDRIRFVLRTNHGAESSRQHAASIARGKYFVLMDSDDLFFPWTIETYGRVVRERNEPPMIIGSIYDFEHGQTIAVEPPTSKRVEVWEYRDLYSRDRPLASSCSQLVLKRTDAERLKVLHTQPTAFPFDTADIMLSMGTTGPWVAVKSPTTVAYRLHASNTIKNLRRMVESAPVLIRLEHQGAYPGGSSLSFARRAYIGGVEIGWIRKAKGGGKYGLALKLLFQASFCVAAAFLRKFARLFAKKTDPIVLPE